jgi:putative membrane protein insertion efficiency factor
MKHLLIAFVKLWRKVVSPIYGDVCRYYPSCSAYGLEALQLHGAIKGSYLAVRRILRCNPWSTGGVDPVPGSALEAEIAAEQAAEFNDGSASQQQCAHSNHIEIGSKLSNILQKFSAVEPAIAS